MTTVSIPLPLAQHLFQRLRAEKQALAEMKKSFAPELQEELDKAIAQNHEDFTQIITAIQNALHGTCRCKQPETQPGSQVCLACGGEWVRDEPEKVSINVSDVVAMEDDANVGAGVKNPTYVNRTKERRTWVLKKGHPSVGTRCPKCRKAFAVGDNTYITNIETEDANTISGDQVHVECPK